MIPVFAAVAAFGAAVVVTRVMEIFSRRQGLLDEPNERSSHAVPTPSSGGVGIIAGVACGLLVAAGWHDAEASLIFAVAMALGVVGLADDLGRVGILGKYLAQLAAAAIVTLALSPSVVVEVPGVSLQVDGLPATLLTLLWLTALINAFNFIDGIDGMLGWLAVTISIVGLGLVAPDAADVLLIIAGACLGFLVWNHPPASIFMGDVGSQFLGLLVGTSLLRQPAEVVAVIPTIMVFAVPLFDTGFTLVRRLLAGKNVFTAHREHLYQRMAFLGRSHRLVTALYASLTAVVGVVALTWPGLPPLGQLAIVAAIVVGLGVLAAWVARMERLAPRAADDGRGRSS